MTDLKDQIEQARVEHFNDGLSEELHARYGGQKECWPPTPDLLVWDLRDELTCEPGAWSDGTCPNTRVRAGLWVRDDPKALDTLANPDAPFLNRLAQLCVVARIHECRSSACLHGRAAMEKFVPACEWPRFRDWAIAVMACQASFTHEQKLTRAHTHLVTAVSLCHWLLIGYKHSSRPIEDILIAARPRPYHVDLAGVCEVIYWMLTIQAHIGVGNVVEGKWGPGFLPHEVVQPALRTARERARRLGVCQYRLQKLTEVAERKEADLPGLMEMAQRYPCLSHNKEGNKDRDHNHSRCTPDDCPPNRADTEKKEQLHKCSERDRKACDRVRYNVDDLEKSIANQGPSNWKRHGQRIAALEERYVAISHVWIDGTGVGNGPDPRNREKMGRVNRCLNDYFLDIVDRLECTAIWWDTISLPTKRELRKKEIAKMQSKYVDATYTVVHDNYLVDFEWADDGSPCVALVLSSWFTRGWTALELHVSKRVKVLYKSADPNTKKPLIKDLDADILAPDPRYATRAYWIASSIIRRLRQPVDNVRDLLTILQPRSTCRLEDRITIAGLLANLEPTDCRECTGESKNQDHIKRHTTRRVLTNLGKVGYASLLHGKEPMDVSGPFSWAPESLCDMPVESGGDLQPGLAFGDGMLTVDQNGRAVGGWYHRGLTQADATSNVQPMDVSSQATATSIKAALQNWQYCLLLRESWQDKGPALLVATVGKEGPDGHVIVDCRYVAAVKVLNDPNTIDRYRYDYVRLGNENGRPDVRARDVVCGDVAAMPTNLPGGQGSDDESEVDSDDESEVDSDDIPADGEEYGWISSDSEGPRRPRTC